MIKDAEDFKEKMSSLRLTPTYPSKEGQHYRVEDGYGSYDTTFPIDGEFEIRLGEENKRMAFFYDFQMKYPFLHPYVKKEGFGFVVTGLWVQRNGRDAEAMPYPKNRETYKYTDEEFAFHNEEARKANQKDWFYCSGCEIAKPISEYAYFHFAGKYCQKCKDEDPSAYKAAMSETYE